MFRILFRGFSFNVPGKEVFINNIPQSFGYNEFSKLIGFPHEAIYRGKFCFLLFQTEFEAAKTIDDLNGKIILGNRIRARFSTIKYSVASSPQVLNNSKVIF